ncbi:MAG: sensor histidine kinase [Thermoplasmatota archaeon]
MASDHLGLQVLERELGLPRWWRWWLAFILASLLGVAAYLLVHATRAVESVPLVERLYRDRSFDEAAAALLVFAVACLGLAVLAVRRALQSGALAHRQRTVLAAIIANVPSAVLVADGLGAFLANAAAVRLFGLPGETGSATEYHAAMARLDRRNPETGLRIPAGAGILEAALDGRVTSMDMLVVTPGGERTLNVSGAPIPFARGLRGGLVLAADVTQRLAIQRDLEAATQSLERKNAEHLQMARTIAHDLGNALTPAEMHLKLLEMGKGDPKRSVPPLQRSVAQMHRLIGDLSDMARLESGAMKVHVQDVPLGPAIAAALLSFEPLAQEKGVGLSKGRVPKATLHADPERLGQVLSNLIGNALKFTPAGGTVAVAATAEEGRVRVAVTDSGIGLDAGQVARLFQPFSQVHDPARVKERGTGLGLFICKGLVERQGGEMGVTSPGPGKGSTFWFTLPVAPLPS